MTLRTPSPEAASRLRDVFREAGYSAAALREVAGTEIPPPSYASLHREVQPRAPGKTPFDLLVRWFFLGVPVEAAAAGGVLPAVTLSTLRDCGLLELQGDALAPNALVTPCEDLWIASDLHQQRDSAAGRDHVQPPSPVSLHLLNFMARRPVGSALDLCCGVGMHAVAAAGFADRVVATDVNPRSAMFAGFNAALNGRENVECVTGDLFEAAAGQRFGLIVCNPPFVVSPAMEFLYKDNPLKLDEFCRRIARAAPGHLEDGGICQIICEWVDLVGAPWQDRLREWFAGTGCDAWVLEANRQLPENYGRGRLREHATPDEERVLADWVAYFDDRRVSAVHGGLIVLRRRDGDNWVSFGELRSQFAEPIGDEVLQGLAGRDFLQEHREDARCLAAKPRVSPQARIREELRWTEGHWRPQAPVLTIEGGIPVSLGIDETVKQILARFDGRRTVAEVLTEIAGGDPGKADRAQMLSLVRTMVENGCLVP